MKTVCAALLTVLLAGFAPGGNQSRVACTATDSANGDHLELSTRIFRNDELFQVVEDVRLVGRWRGQDIDRTFSASKFMMNKQIDKDGQFRLSLHSRPIEDERVKWFIREAPATDGFDFTLPAQLGAPRVEGHLSGRLPDRPDQSVTASASCTATSIDGR